MKKLFLPVFTDSKFQKQAFFNIQNAELVEVVNDQGEWLQIKVLLTETADEWKFFVMVNEWNDFMREHALGVPRRTVAADIHLGAIADGVSDLVACFKK